MDVVHKCFIEQNRVIIKRSSFICAIARRDWFDGGRHSIAKLGVSRKMPCFLRTACLPTSPPRRLHVSFSGCRRTDHRNKNYNNIMQLRYTEAWTDFIERPRTRHSDDGSGCEEHTASAYLAVLVSWFDDSALLLHRTRSHFSKQQCWDEELKKQCHAMTIWLLSDEKDRLEQTINLLRKESLLLLFYLATHFAVHRD